MTERESQQLIEKNDESYFYDVRKSRVKLILWQSNKLRLPILKYRKIFKTGIF